MNAYKRVAAYINLDAIEANFEAMKKRLPEETMMAAVIKTDGYGHGAVPIAHLMEEKPYIWGFAVATVEEAMELRKAGILKPVLILGYTFPESYETLVREEIRPTVFRLDMAEALSKEAVRQGKTLPIHIKLDTGMSRIGFADNAQSIEVLKSIQQLPGLALEGLFTHFAKADEREKAPTHKQLLRYLTFAKNCQEEGILFPIYHCCNSAGIMELPEAGLTMARAGISLYGLYPSDEVRRDFVPLQPAMELKSHIAHIKEIEAGTSVSYGGTYTAEEKRRIATIPVGYGDGYPRSLSNKGYVLIAGKKAPICGRICMDQFMVDVTDIPEAEQETEVTLLGTDRGEVLTMEELGDMSGRFNYEFACDLSKRIPRIYLRGGEVTEVKDWYRS